MTFLLRAFALIATAATAAAGEYFRFDAPIGPDQRNATVHGFAFTEHDETLRVVDLVEAKAPHMGDAFAALGAQAGSNGGPTRADGQPLGLMIANRVKTGSLVTDSPEAAGLLRVQQGAIALLHAATVTPDQWEQADSLVQGGPFLVENGAATPALDADRYARRTVIVTSGTGDWAILYVPATTLDSLARMLADGKTFPRFRIAAVLNLAGGTASGIWLQRADGARSLYLREIATGRNALAIIPK
jgi:hypothetical protein